MARHGVGPKLLRRVVRSDLQYGHCTGVSKTVNTSPPCRLGGAIPIRWSLSRPDSEIQSVVQGGLNDKRTLTSANPRLATLSLTAVWIAERAGQPENVGASTISTRSPSRFTARTMPSSTMETTGISGSATSSKALKMSASVIVVIGDNLEGAISELTCEPARFGRGSDSIPLTIHSNAIRRELRRLPVALYRLPSAACPRSRAGRLRGWPPKPRAPKPAPVRSTRHCARPPGLSETKCPARVGPLYAAQET